MAVNLPRLVPPEPPGSFPMWPVTAQTPADVLALLVALVGMLAPGAVLAWALARRLRLGWAAAIPGALAISGAIATLIMLVGGRLGLPVVAGVAAYVIAGVGLSAWGLALAKGQPVLEADRPGLLLGLAAVVMALIERPWFKVSADTFYHLAAARSLLVRDALVVTDPFHGTATVVPDPSSGVLHTMMALTSRMSAMDMAQLFSGVTALGALALALSFYVLATRMACGNARVAAWATAGYLVANQFADFRALGYPNRLSMALISFALAMLVETIVRPSRPAAALAVAAGVTVCAMHVGNAEFYLLLLGAAFVWAWVLVAWTRVRDGAADMRGALAVTGVLAFTVALAVPLLLPKLGVVGGSTIVAAASFSRPELWRIGPLVVTRAGRFFDGGDIAFGLTFALAVLSGGWALVRRDRTAAATFAIVSLPGLLLAFPPVTTFFVRWSYYNLERLAALTGFTLFVGIAWALARAREERGGRQALALGGASLAIAALLALPYLQTTFTERVGAVRQGMNVSVWRSRDGDIRNLWGYETIDRFRVLFGDGNPMIAGDPETCYYLASLVDVRIAAVSRSHSPLAIELKSGRRRRADMRSLLLPTETVAERRAILDRYGATYVLVWRSRLREREAGVSMRNQPELFEVADESKRLTLFRVKR
ncbi:MAG: hypothetical protein Q7W30_00170 [Coriobacteriia bacterium]|nr:hypothetical protein [Coriobacteriia bacterium]